MVCDLIVISKDRYALDTRVKKDAFQKGLVSGLSADLGEVTYTSNLVQAQRLIDEAAPASTGLVLHMDSGNTIFTLG